MCLCVCVSVCVCVLQCLNYLTLRSCLFLSLPYTVYPVRWDTQKGDILEVCVQKVSHLGWGDKCLIFVCVCVPSPLVPSQKADGGTLVFQNLRDLFKGLH